MSEQIPNDPTMIPEMKRKPRIPWFGVILILLGAFFMAENAGWITGHFNWWALFIFIPAFGSLSGAWYAYSRNHSFSAAVGSGLGGGLVILTVALMFLFDLDWSDWWPLMLIVPGFAGVLGALPGVKTDQNQVGRAWLGLSGWVGMSVMLLGGAFLLNNLGYIDIRELTGQFRWYGLFVLLPGLGALVNCYLAWRTSGFNWGVRSLLIVGVIICTVGGMIVAGLDWNLLGPAVIIAGGLGLLLTSFNNKA
ncbi:MAG TPA: hypothetical protein VN376_03325, partial [Longilinea sp.]|nr:hypothetical protein [Longilinea sp.]